MCLRWPMFIKTLPILHKTPFSSDPHPFRTLILKMAPSNPEMLSPRPAALYSGLLHFWRQGLAGPERSWRTRVLGCTAVISLRTTESCRLTRGQGVGWWGKAGHREDGSCPTVSRGALACAHPQESSPLPYSQRRLWRPCPHTLLGGRACLGPAAMLPPGPPWPRASCPGSLDVSLGPITSPTQTFSWGSWGSDHLTGILGFPGPGVGWRDWFPLPLWFGPSSQLVLWPPLVSPSAWGVPTSPLLCPVGSPSSLLPTPGQGLPTAWTGQ